MTTAPEPREDGYTLIEGLYWYSPKELWEAWDGNKAFCLFVEKYQEKDVDERSWGEIWLWIKEVYSALNGMRSSMASFLAMQQGLINRLCSREILGFGFEEKGGSVAVERTLIPPDVWGGKMPDWKQCTVEGLGRKFVSVRVIKPAPTVSDEEAANRALAAVNGWKGRGRPNKKSMILRAFDVLQARTDLSDLSISKRGELARRFVWEKYPDLDGDDTDLGDRTIDNHFKKWLAEQEEHEIFLENNT